MASHFCPASGLCNTAISGLMPFSSACRHICTLDNAGGAGGRGCCRVAGRRLLPSWRLLRLKRRRRRAPAAQQPSTWGSAQCAASEPGSMTVCFRDSEPNPIVAGMQAEIVWCPEIVPLAQTKSIGLASCPSVEEGAMTMPSCWVKGAQLRAWLRASLNQQALGARLLALYRRQPLLAQWYTRYSNGPCIAWLQNSKSCYQLTKSL